MPAVKRRWTVPTRRSTFALASAALAVLGCDSTAPSKRLVVDVSLDAQPTPAMSDTPYGPLISCTVNLTAAAQGEGSATWRDASVLWYIGANRNVAVDSMRSAALTVQHAWGGETITVGETRHASWSFANGVPFDVSFVFRYSVASGKPESSATARFSCGTSAVSGAPPVVTNVGVRAPPGLKIGDAIDVLYAESSASGVWQTVIKTSGAFDLERVLGERLATSVDRVAKIVVPAGARSDVPLTVTVTAYDAALQVGSLTHTTQLALSP